MSGPTVLSMPSDHPYVRAVTPAAARLVGPEAEPWWSAESWSVPHLSRRLAAQRVEVAHLHFGFESVSPEDLTSWCAELARHQVPLVVTVHDLDNPHLVDQAVHHRRLTVLVDHAAVVVAITAGAAAEVRRRYGARPVVIEHPSLLADGVPWPDRPVVSGGTARPVVGVPLRVLRANVVAPHRTVATLAETAARHAAGLELMLPEDFADHLDLAAAVRRAAAMVPVSAVVAPRLPEFELLHRMAGWHALVLPYAWGSHSGWVEHCRDLGVIPVAPDRGYYGAQWDAVHTFGVGRRTGPDPAGLAAAVAAALAAPRPVVVGAGDRTRRRERVRRQHAAVYARATASARGARRAG